MSPKSTRQNIRENIRLSLHQLQLNVVIVISHQWDFTESSLTVMNKTPSSFQSVKCKEIKAAYCVSFQIEMLVDVTYHRQRQAR